MDIDFSIKKEKGEKIIIKMILKYIFLCICGRYI